MAEPSSAPKPVVVRVKRKSFQSPPDAFWLEINDRPLKRPLLDFESPSISDSVQMGFEIGERLDFVNLSISESAQKEDYVYDLYTVNDVVPVEDSSNSYPLLKVQVDNEDYYDGPDDSDYETDDSNAEDDPHNDYPDEISEEEDDTFECESEESEHSSTSDESTDEDLEHHGFSKDVADPLNDEELMIMKV